jgi:hypothetical protein
MAALTAAAGAVADAGGAGVMGGVDAAARGEVGFGDGVCALAVVGAVLGRTSRTNSTACAGDSSSTARRTSGVAHGYGPRTIGVSLAISSGLGLDHRDEHWRFGSGPLGGRGCALAADRELSLMAAAWLAAALGAVGHGAAGQVLVGKPGEPTSKHPHSSYGGFGG